MSESHPAPTPMVNGGDTDEYSPLFADITLYKSLVGSLLYTATYTRPDIAFAVAKAGQAFTAPTERDWKAAKRILRYLKGTMDYSLVYKSQDKPQLIGYSDADWAGDRCDRKSISGFVFTYGNSIISWASKKQQCVSLSSTEAEYVAGSMAAQEATYLRNLLAELHHRQEVATTLFQDNQSAIVLANDTVTTKRSKHIEIKYHYIRDCVERKLIMCQYINTRQMLADCMTKAVAREILDFACGKLFP